MQDSPFYHGTIHKIVSTLGTVFNEIYITKATKSGSKTIHVPIRYGPKSHYFAALQKLNSASDTVTSADLPQMSFMLGSLAYAPDRKMNTMNRYKAPETANTRKSVFAPAPYDFEFELSIFSKGSEDAFRVLEQILPMFQPHMTVRISSLEDVDLKENIVIQLAGVSADDNWESGSETNRLIQWTVGFKVEGFLYPAIRSAPIIRDVIIDIENDWLDPPQVVSTINEHGDTTVFTPDFAPEFE